MFKDAESVKEKFPAGFLAYEEFRNQPTIIVKPEAVFEVLRFLKDDPSAGYDLLVDVTAVDHGAGLSDNRFSVVYHLCRTAEGKRLRLKAFLNADKPVIESVVPLWLAANWAEREAYDLMGITFRNHPDLRRIMLPDSFEHHPLRKDYPVEGRGERDSFIKYNPDDGL